MALFCLDRRARRSHGASRASRRGWSRVSGNIMRQLRRRRFSRNSILQRRRNDSPHATPHLPRFRVRRGVFYCPIDRPSVSSRLRELSTRQRHRRSRISSRNRLSSRRECRRAVEKRCSMLCACYRRFLTVKSLWARNLRCSRARRRKKTSSCRKNAVKHSAWLLWNLVGAQCCRQSSLQQWRQVDRLRAQINSIRAIR